jgi:lysophospholipase L1-like esterase
MLEEIPLSHTNRRNFVRTGLLGTASLALANAASAQADDRANASGVAGYDYRLPSFPPGTRLLFQGDSITDMNWGRNEQDRNHYLGHSYVYLIAARLGVDMPEAKLEFFNRGQSGNKVADLKNRWQTDAIALKPDVLSILIGVNDVGGSDARVALDEWEANYRFILDASRNANPALRLVLLDPFVLRVGPLDSDSAWPAWRGEVDKLCPIVTKLAADYQAVHIKTQEIFDQASQKVAPSHWIWDGVHPLPQGHELIARNWLQTVSEQAA